MSAPNIEPVYPYLGARIRHLREMHGITQDELSRRIQCTRSHIANMEAGTTRIMLHDLGEIADALKTKPEQLLKGIWLKSNEIEGEQP